MKVMRLCAACGGSTALVVLMGLSVAAWQPANAPAATGPTAGAIAVLLPAQSGFGTIKGRLVWGGKEVPKPEILVSNSKDPEVCAAMPLKDRGLVIDPATKGIQFAYAYLVNPKGKNPEAEANLLAQAPAVVIDQKNCEFLPYSTAAFKGQKFVFKSSDAVGHNSHYTGFVNNKNIALPPNGKAEEKLAPEKRQITLKCDIHPWMKGWIMVFDHPFYAVTQPDGSFEIKGVPAGVPQNLIVWQEKVGYVTEGAAKGKSVTVEPGKVVDMGLIVLDPAKVKK